MNAMNIQKEWKQVSHICYWELMWCYALKMEWKKAAQYSEVLRLMIEEYYNMRTMHDLYVYSFFFGIEARRDSSEDHTRI